VDIILAIALVVALFAGSMAVWRGSFRAKPEEPPTLASLLEREVDAELAAHTQTFRRPHFMQTMVYFVASAIILVSFIVSFLSNGLTLLSLLLGVAEVLLILTHGTPLLINITRTLTISPEGVESRDVFGRRSIDWWEVQHLLVADDLSRFRAEGVRSKFTADTSAFAADTRITIYRTLRAHLAGRQLELETWPQGARLLRFVKANGLSLGIFAAVMIATALAGSQLLPEGNVLGLRCAYASGYLREKYDLPDRNGCVVMRVNQGTGAHRAGLREGDLIVGVEGVPITSGPQFTTYWESLEKRTQKFTVIRPGETDEVELKVTLGGHGRLPDYDPEDPYFFYLRARGAEDSSQAILDFTTAIELDPEFDLAYVYRGALYTEANVPDMAIADFNKALELDPTLTEAYRERAWYDVFTLDYEAAADDSESAIELDRCEGGFETYNYDCHMNHLTLALAYGERGDSDSLRRGVEEAERAAAFYPERPRSYYLAAYYLASLEEFGRAQDYAATYLTNAEEFGEPGNLIDWAQRLLSGNAVPDSDGGPAAAEELQPSALFIDCCLGDGAEPVGEPVFTHVTFAAEREVDAPQGVLYLTPDRSHVWAYFEFDNAANVQNVYWEWRQNSLSRSSGFEPWLPGFNKGRAWIRLENYYPNEMTENSLLLRFDDGEDLVTNFYLRDDPYVGAVAFSADAQGEQPLLFYAGEQPQVYFRFEYIGPELEHGLAYFVEKDGAQLAAGTVPVAGSGTQIVPIMLPPTVTPGIIDVRLYLDAKLMRSGALALTTPEIAASPPFDSFKIGLEPDGNGGLLKVTRDLSRNTPEFYYFVGPFHMEPSSTLSVRWLINGVPLGGGPETVSGSQNGNTILNFVPGHDGFLAAGEYSVVVSLDTQPVYADVVVVR
jgi:tetratricopeptide (TPR) repeat protein